MQDTTASLFGLGADAVPDDAFSKLSAASLIAKVPKYTETTLGGFAVGQTIKLKVAGVAKEFIVVHHGKPSDLYDDSCDGAWLLMKDIYESRQWHKSNSNSYKASTIHSYLNSTFLGLFDSDIQAAIKEVKIPYVNGTANSAVASGENGLAAKIFLLSGYEVGWTQSTNSYFPIDGACLSYFSGTAETDSKRIGYLNGAATLWWLRSPDTNSTTSAWRVSTEGSCSRVGCSSSYGIRPALVLPDTTVVYVDSNGNIHGEQEYEETITDILGAPFTGGVKIATGSYTGTGTYGPSNPNSLTFDFEPKLVYIYKTSGTYTYQMLCGVGAVRTPTVYAGDSGTASLSRYSIVMNLNGNQLTWYDYASQSPQLNEVGETYNYIAIG